MFTALHALHSLKVMHGDLKPANILVLQSRGTTTILITNITITNITLLGYTVKLCDFDSARILTNDDTCLFPYDASTGHLKYTEMWVAPEVYQSNKLCNGGKLKGALSIDIFNLGLIAVLLEDKHGRYDSDIVLPSPNTDDYDKALTEQSFLDNKVLKIDDNSPYRDMLMKMCR